MPRHLHLLAALAAVLAFPVAAPAQDAPGSFKVPGTETTLTLYGYVQVFGLYDLSSRPTPIENADWATIVPAQPLHGTPDAKQTGQLYFTARTSRIGITTSTPTAVGAVGTKLEGDFNGDAGQTYTNSYRFRLRHAYGTFHGFLVGQTWTQFLDFGSAPDTVDFNGPGTLALVRQAQVRYTFQPTQELSAGVSLENSANNMGKQGINGSIPDIVLKASYTPGWGSVAVGVLTNQYRYKKATDSADEAPKKHSIQGWGAEVGGSYKLFGKDTLVALVVGGDGIGRYLFNLVANGDPELAFGGFTDSGSAKLWRAFGYHVGYTHVWTASVRSNAVWSQTFLDRNGISRAAAASQNKRIDQLFLNTFVGVAKNAEVGLEYELGRRHTFSRQTGYQDRITASATYKFF